MVEEESGIIKREWGCATLILFLFYTQILKQAFLIKIPRPIATCQETHNLVVKLQDKGYENTPYNDMGY